MKSLCTRALVVLMIWAPCHLAQAGMMATDSALRVAGERSVVLDFFGRSDVARELQALGIEPAAARERVAAMSDDEVRALSGRITTLPAGADVAGILLLVVVVALIWWLWKR